MAVAQQVLGGAMARVPADATAFAHRDRRFMAGVGAVYEQAADRPIHEAWADSFSAALRRDGRPGVYVNFLSDEGPDRVREAYPALPGTAWSSQGGRYDPGNLFHRSKNIPGAHVRLTRAALAECKRLRRLDIDRASVRNVRIGGACPIGGQRWATGQTRASPS